MIFQKFPGGAYPLDSPKVFLFFNRLQLPLPKKSRWKNNGKIMLPSFENFLLRHCIASMHEQSIPFSQYIVLLFGFRVQSSSKNFLLRTLLDIIPKYGKTQQQFLFADQRECFNKYACCKKLFRRCSGNGLVAKRNSQILS